ncbi:MAG: phosphatase PAP2 family protein [Candidatus Aenigmarchaeota archaeon]|nr:phosphatase PAP2 family protein [Candidatus Aenigmarchaeota archaeon]
MALEFLQQLDTSILIFINKTLANPFFDFIFQFTHLFPYIFWALLIGFFVLKQKNKLALLMIIAVALDLLLVPVLKTTISRERPYQVLDVRQLVPEEDNTSFPSNHTMLSFLLSTIVLSYYRRFGMALYALSILVAIGRVYVGVHYPSDVIGGALIGIMLAFAMLKFENMLFRKKE